MVVVIFGGCRGLGFGLVSGSMITAASWRVTRRFPGEGGREEAALAAGKVRRLEWYAEDTAAAYFCLSVCLSVCRRALWQLSILWKSRSSPKPPHHQRP